MYPRWIINYRRLNREKRTSFGLVVDGIKRGYDLDSSQIRAIVHLDECQRFLLAHSSHPTLNKYGSICWAGCIHSLYTRDDIRKRR